MKTVLFFSHSADYYGAEKILFTMVSGFRSTFRIHVVLPGPGVLAEKLAQLPEVETHYFPMLRFNRKAADFFYNCRYLPRYVLRLRALLTAIRPDVVYCNTIRHVPTVMFAHLMRYPVIFHGHERNIDGLPGRLFAAILLRCADRLIFVCKYAAESYYLFSPELAIRSRIIYNGIAPPTVSGQDGMKKRWQIVLASVASLEPHKRLIDLVSAMPLILEHVPGAGLLIVGDGSERDRLKESVKALGLAEKVELTGFRSDVQTILEGVDVFVAPFANEGLNTAAIEAMYHGKPVVAAASGGLMEIVEKGKTGLFYEVGNVEQLAACIITLANAPEMRIAMGRAGAIRAGKMFVIEQQNEQLSAMIIEIACRCAQ